MIKVCGDEIVTRIAGGIGIWYCDKSCEMGTEINESGLGSDK